MQKVFTLPKLHEGMISADGNENFFHCPHNFDFPVGTNYETKVIYAQSFVSGTLVKLFVCCLQVLDVSYFEGHSGPATNDSVNSKGKVSPRQTKSSQPESFNKKENSTEAQLKGWVESSGVVSPEQAGHMMKTKELKHSRVTNSAAKKKLLAQSNKRALLEEKSLLLDDESIPPLTYSPVADNNQADKHHHTKTAYIHDSIEHALPSPNIPVSAQNGHVETTDIWTPDTMRDFPPRQTVAMNMREEIIRMSEEQPRGQELAEIDKKNRSLHSLSPPRSGRMRQCPSSPMSMINSPGDHSSKMENVISVEARSRNHIGGERKRERDSLSPPRPGSTRMCQPSPSSALNPPGRLISSTNNCALSKTLLSPSSHGNHSDLTENLNSNEAGFSIETLAAHEFPFHNDTIFSFAHENYTVSANQSTTPDKMAIKKPYESIESFTFDPDPDNSVGEHDRIVDEENMEAHMKSRNVGREVTEVMLWKLTSHFNDLKQKFIEEYGENEASMLFRT